MNNNISARKSQQTATSSIKSKKNGTAETAGSLASKAEKSYLAMNSYDTIQFNSPYSLNIDFSNYSEIGYSNAPAGGFLSGFSEAVALIGTDCAGASFTGVSSGASTGSSSCGGGFTSFV